MEKNSKNDGTFKVSCILDNYHVFKHKNDERVMQ